MSRTILHVDLDSFYASVETLLDPTLAGRPVIVGGDGPRGVVASCSYEARAFGIHSAMPSVQAKRRCPHAVFLHGRFDVYAEYSSRFHEVLGSYTTLVEGISLDEAFLDVTAASARRGGVTIARDLRRRVRDEVGLDCAVGVAANKLLAKLASKAAKPTPSRQGPVEGAGVVSVDAGGELDFLHPLPVRALWGVGPATQRRLDRFGVRTVGDLAALPLATLVNALGASLGGHLHDLARGIDDRPVVPSAPAKSIGHEETFSADLYAVEDCRRELVRLADAVGTRLAKAGVAGRTVSLKVRFGDFRTISRATTFDVPTAAPARLAAAAASLLGSVDIGRGVRLLGLSVSNLSTPPAEQLTLDAATSDAAADRAAAAVERVRERFGDAAVGPAALLDGGGIRLKRAGDTQWGPRRGD